MFLAQEPTDNVNIGSAKIVYIQPNADCSLRRKDAKADQLTNVRYFNYSPSDWYYLCLRNRGVRSNNTNPVFMTDSGYESCSCSRDIDNIRKKCNNTPVNDSCHRQRKTGRAMEHNQFEFIIEDDEECFEDDTFAMPTKEKLPPLTRSASCNSGKTSVRSSRRVSVLVDELLLKIYGGQTERRCSAGTDIHTFEGSTDSSNSFKSNTSLLKKKRSFSGIPEDKCRKWNNMVRTRLMHKSVTELKTLKATLEYNVSHAGSQLIRQLKRRDFLYSRRDAQCSIITAFLQAVSAKRSEDMKIQFSMRPNAGESGFQQWHGAMKMVARLSGGIPREFRKTLWLTLAERHIISKNINWIQVERTCFNDLTNPDDEELGIQIVKDLHRTGCTLFCGTSGEENQAVLKRVLLAYARWNKFVGYCQGFNMLAALILEVMDRSENNSLKVMIFLIEGVLPESYFANNLQGLSIDMAVFRDLLRLKLPLLSRHLEQLQTGSNDAGNIYEPPLMNVFTMQWFLTMFCNCLPHSTVLRVWDLIFLEGNQMLLKTALAIWDTLSDRIMPVKSADEFYSIMGVLTREMLEFGLMDANLLIKTITNIELPDLTELRERYIYNITPWSQMARKGLRLFYGGDESDNSDDDPSIDDKSSTSEGAYRFLKAATRHGSQSIRSISPSSILGPFVNEKEKKALDISALKKQYSKIKEHQRQAQIIFTAACNSHGFMGSMVSSTTAPAINHLMLSKNAAASVTKVSHSIQKTPPIPVARAVQRLKETSSILGDEAHKDRGETLYWNKRMKKRKRRRSEMNFQTCCDSSKPDPDTLNDSDSSTTTSSSSSFKSSSSTELCDELVEFDSEDANTSLSECCPSPLQNKLQLSIVSLIDDDKLVATSEKSEPCLPKSDLPLDTSGYVSSDHTHENLCNNEGDSEKIFNLLLTTSIIASEQLSKQEDTESTIGFRSMKIENEEGATVSDEGCVSQKRLNHFIHNMNKLSRTLSDTANVDSNPLLSKTYSTDDYSNTNENILDAFERVKNEDAPNAEENSELESALEHMKIDALEILFSSSTLNSIRNDTMSNDELHTTSSNNENEKFSNFSLPTPTLEKHPKKAFQIDEKTELELREILQENTELLKKVNQNYTSYDSNVDVGAATITDTTDDECAAVRNRTNVNYSPTLLFVSTETEISDKESDQFIHCDSKPDDPATELLSRKLVDDIGDYSDPRRNELILEKFDECSVDNYSSNVNCLIETDLLCDEDCSRVEYEIEDKSLKLMDDNFSAMRLSPLLHQKDFDCMTSPSDSSLYYLKSETDDENCDSKRLPGQKKHKSLDSLNSSKNKSDLKVGLVDQDSKWISISIDNSDLVILNDIDTTTKESKDESTSEAVKAEAISIGQVEKEEQYNSKTKNSSKQPTADPYLFLNFDIIPTRKKKKSPMQEYVNKKNILSQNYRPTELSSCTYSPFPLRPGNRPPKELGVKLGLYSPAKK